MFKSFLKTTLRKLAKDRQYTLINVVGLSTGFALFLIISLYVQRELAVDSHYQDYDLIYRVNSRYTNQAGNTSEYASSYEPTAEALRDDFPEVEAAAMFYSPSAQFSFRSGDNLISVEKDQIYYATTDFFEVFNVDWVTKGEPFSGPNTTIISDQLAIRFFGNENPVGKTLTYEVRGQKHDLLVTSVYRKSSKPSHIDFDMLINYDATINFWKGGIDNNWGFMYVFTYFKANQPLPLDEWDQKLAEMRGKYKPNSTSIEFRAQGLKDIYWSPQEYEPGTNGNKAYIYVFGAFGITLILLAVVNFVNLMTARSLKRSKEVAVRKVVGASRKGLVMQFLTESTVLSFVAMLLGAVAAERLTGPINASLDLSLRFDIFGNGFLLALVLILPLIVGLLSGTYPAFVLSSFKAFSLLGGPVTWSMSHHRLRDVLLALQFMISVVVISGVLVISGQMDYIKTRGLGFKEDPVVVLPRINNNSNYLIRQAVAQSPDIKGIASLSSIPGYRTPRQRNIKENGTTGDGFLSNGIWVSEQYAEIIGLTFVSGRNFTAEDRENTVILNERAVSELGWDAFEAIGKNIVMTGRDGFDATTYEVVGVTEDYHYQSLYENVAPLFLKNNSKWRSGADASIVQIPKGQLESALNYLEGVWSEIEKEQAFGYYFLDDAVSEVYEKEIKLSKTVNYVSGISMLVCLLGLYGLVSLHLQSRRKEIGIRKVLGATWKIIARLFARKYLWIISLSVLLGLPVSYKLLKIWLANFAYSTGYSFTTYFFVGLLLIMVSLTLVGFLSVSASRINPVETLRDE